MSLRIWLPLNGTLDNQGLDDIVVTNNGATIDNSGKIGKCYSFDGSNDYISFPCSFPSEDWSYSIWFYTTSTNTQTLGCCRNGVGFGFSIFLISNKVRIDGIIGNNQQQWTTTYTFPTNIWVNLIVTSKNGLLKYYINGEYQTSKTVIVNNTKLGNIFTIGASQTNGSSLGNYFKGKINDVRIYDHALSSMEVKQISQGLVLHYPLNNNGWGQENLHKNSDTITSTWSIYQGTVSNGIATITPSSGSDRRIYQMPANGGWSWELNKTYTASIDARSPNGATLILYPYGAGSMNKSYTVTPQWKRYSFTFTATQSGTGSMTYHVNQTSGVTLQLKHPKLELGQKATSWCPNSLDKLYNTLGLNDNVEYDTSGFCNNGTRTGTFSWTSDTPKYQVSSVFDSNSIIDTPVIITSTNLISQYTAAVWIKRNNTDTTNNHCFFTGPIELFIQGRTSRIRFYWSHATSTSSMANNTWDPLVTINNSIWTHIVVTFADGVLKCYINGELSNTSDRSSTGQYIYGNRYHTIGSYHDTTEKFIGQICDVRAYATALSAEDVKSLYHNSAYIDNQGNIYGAMYEEV